jgi:hypothetical protein
MEPYFPGQRSRTIRVPSGVPSLAHGAGKDTRDIRDSRDNRIPDAATLPA